MRNRTITVADGYTGSIIILNADDVLDSTDTALKLHVEDCPWLIRWVYHDEYNLKLKIRVS